MAAGDLDRALSLTDQALGDPAVADDPVRRAEVVVRRAVALRGLSRDEEAVAELQDALADLPPERLTTAHALVLAPLANALCRAGQDEQGLRLTETLIARSERDAAAEAAREGLRLAAGMGAAIEHELRDLADRARLRVDTPATAEGTGQFRLTGREREVLKLIADGQSNGQIAATLFISPKTVSVHVSNILAKLGVSGRAQATSLAHRVGLFADDPLRRE